MRIAKQISKKFSLLLAALMVLSVFLSAGVFGAGGTITINAPKDTEGQSVSLAGLTFNAYQILGQEASTGRYIATAEFQNFFNQQAYEETNIHDATGNVYVTYNSTSNQLEYSATPPQTGVSISFSNTSKLDDKYFVADLISRFEESNGSLRTLANWLTEYAQANSFTGQAAACPVSGDADGSVQMTVSENGYFLVAMTGSAPGVTIQNSILQVVNDNGTPGNGDVTIDLKADLYPLEKTVNTPSASVGDNLNYTITTEVPNTNEYTQLNKFELSDTMVNQDLTNSFSMTIGTAPSATTVDYIPTEDGGTFSVEQRPIATLTINRTPGDNGGVAANDSFIIDFDESELAAYSGQDLVLTYSATLNANAIDVNGNDVRLDISNGPNDDYTTSHTDVYTYGLDITKIFSDESKDFSNVRFNLKSNAQGAQNIKFTKDDATGIYTVSTDQGATDALTPDATGKITVKGLAAGIYTLTETSTKEGFNEAEPITITLTGTTGDLAQLDNSTSSAMMGTRNLNATINNADPNGINMSLLAFTVLNQKGFSIPNTGAMGTTLLTIGGIVLIVAAVGALVIARRKSAK